MIDKKELEKIKKEFNEFVNSKEFINFIARINYYNVMIQVLESGEKLNKKRSPDDSHKS